MAGLRTKILCTYGQIGLDFAAQIGPSSLRPTGCALPYWATPSSNSSNLADEHVLTSVIEEHLAACPALANNRAEVLNFGVSGYGTAQQYLMLQQQVASFRPNLVLLALYVGNDVMNNSLALSAENQKARPYFVELPSGELRLDTSFRDTDIFLQAIESDWQRRLVNKSYILQALKQFYVTKSIAPSSIEPKNSYAAQTAIYFPPESSQLFSSPPNDVWLSAWSVTEKLLLRMRDWVLQQHWGFGLVIIPAPIEALPGEDVRRAASHAFNVAELDYPAKRISQSRCPERHSLSEPRRFVPGVWRSRAGLSLWLPSCSWKRPPQRHR